MSSILVTPTDKKELELLLTLLSKMRIKSQVVESEEVEDFLLGIAMLEADRTEKVSEAEIMAQINAKL